MPIVNLRKQGLTKVSVGRGAGSPSIESIGPGLTTAKGEYQQSSQRLHRGALPHQGVSIARRHGALWCYGAERGREDGIFSRSRALLRLLPRTPEVSGQGGRVFLGRLASRAMELSVQASIQLSAQTTPPSHNIFLYFLLRIFARA